MALVRGLGAPEQRANLGVFARLPTEMVFRVIALLVPGTRDDDSVCEDDCARSMALVALAGTSREWRKLVRTELKVECQRRWFEYSLDNSEMYLQGNNSWCVLLLDQQTASRGINAAGWGWLRGGRTASAIHRRSVDPGLQQMLPMIRKLRISIRADSSLLGDRAWLGSHVRDLTVLVAELAKMMREGCLDRVKELQLDVFASTTAWESQVDQCWGGKAAVDMTDYDDLYTAWPPSIHWSLLSALRLFSDRMMAVLPSAANLQVAMALRLSRLLKPLLREVSERKWSDLANDLLLKHGELLNKDLAGRTTAVILHNRITDTYFPREWGTRSDFCDALVERTEHLHGFTFCLCE